MKKILIVAAHPDDEILGCGGTMARHTAAGDEVRTLILGEGVAARAEETDVMQKMDTLKECARSANRVVGVGNVMFCDVPDNKFDSVPLLSIVQRIEKVIDSFQPGIVYTHSESDVNVDHCLVFRAMQAACRPMEGGSIKEMYTFEVPSSTEWNFSRNTVFAPNVFVDISDSLNAKLKALECYADEMREFPHPRSPEYIRALAQVRGGQSGLCAAEAFECSYHISRNAEKQV